MHRPKGRRTGQTNADSYTAALPVFAI